VKTKTKKFRFYHLFYILLVIGILYAGHKLWVQHRLISTIETPEFGQYLGNPDGEKVIVEFVDYRCSYCRQLHGSLTTLLEQRDDVKIVVRHYPIFGLKSVTEAKFALAASIQGHFEPVHTALMSRNTPIALPEIEKMATDMGLDVEQLKNDMVSKTTTDVILKNFDTWKILGLEATPSLYINGTVYAGTPDINKLNELLARAYGEDEPDDTNTDTDTQAQQDTAD